MRTPYLNVIQRTEQAPHFDDGSSCDDDNSRFPAVENAFQQWHDLRVRKSEMPLGPEWSQRPIVIQKQYRGGRGCQMPYEFRENSLSV